MLSLLLVIVLTVSFTACGNGSDDKKSSENQTITLNVWHQWSNDTNELKKIYDQAVEEYMNQHPNITINTEILDTEAYKAKISAEFAGSATDIDVFYYWGSGMARKLIKADKLLALDEYISHEVRESVLPGAADAFEYRGHYYSLPSFSWYMTLFCNKKIFDKAGLKIPSTYDELLKVCIDLRKVQGIIPIASGAKDGWNAAFIYQALALREVGATKINQMLEGITGFEDQGYLEAAKKVTELYEAGAFGDNPLEMGSDDANAIFLSGNAAMRFNGSWFANQVYTDASALIAPEDVVACKIPMIAGKGNESDYCGGFVESFWVNKRTEYKKEAAEFAIYINRCMGKRAYESGTGFSGWNDSYDESGLNPLFLQIEKYINEGDVSVLAWDTSLDANPAKIHNDQVQRLFSQGADLEEFIDAHKQAISKR